VLERALTFIFAALVDNGEAATAGGALLLFNRQGIAGAVSQGVDAVTAYQADRYCQFLANTHRLTTRGFLKNDYLFEDAQQYANVPARPLVDAHKKSLIEFF